MKLEKLSKNEMSQIKGGRQSSGEWIYVDGDWIYIEKFDFGEEGD